MLEKPQNYWQLKRDGTGDALKLPQDMHWTDEFDWSDLAQSNPVYTVDGSVIVQQGLKQSGRPITLGGEWVWLNRGDYEQLQSWSAVPEMTMTLTHYDRREFSVIFRNHEKPIACKPVIYLTPEDPDAPYTGEIRLMTI